MPAAIIPERFPAYDGDEPYIFVSYAHKDSSRVFPHISRLNQAGYRVWYDNGIDPGNEWSEAIAKSIRGCSVFLAFISPNAAASRNVRAEMHWAIAEGKSDNGGFVCMYLEETELPLGLSFKISEIQALYLNRMSADECWNKLKNALPRSVRRLESLETTSSLESYAAEALEGESRAAKDAELFLQPSPSPVIQGYTVALVTQPARILAGDICDYFFLKGSRHGMLVADVCGKGISAVLTAAMFRGAVNAAAIDHHSPSSVLCIANRILFPHVRVDMFLSAVYLILEDNSPSILISRAGHTHPLIWRSKSRTIEIIKCKGLGIGIDGGNVFDRVATDVRAELEEGDLLVVYSDGVTEAFSESNENDFGEERLFELIREGAQKGPQEVAKTVLEELRIFTGKRFGDDDRSLLVIQKCSG